METSLIPAVCKSMTENGVLSDAMWTNNLKNTVISGAKTKSGSLETVDGPCCGLLGDAPGMGGVRNRVVAAHTGAVCGVAQRYEQFLILALGDYRMGPDTSLALDSDRSQKMEDLKKQCVCVSNEQSYSCS